MKIKISAIPIHGIVPPMVTPLLAEDKLDSKSLKNVVEHLIKGGVHGIFILGSTGEAPSLSYKLRYQLVEETCAQVAGRVPVLVGITDTSFVESVNLANFAKEKKATAVVLAPPYYFPAGQPELVEYVNHLVSEISIPLFLYNMPSFTKVYYEIETVEALSENKKIIGIKDSSGNMVYYHRLLQLFKNRKDFSILMGNEALLAESILLGGHGGVPGGANLFPNLFVRLYDAAQKKDLNEVRNLQDKVMKLSSTIYNVGKYGSSFLKGIKCGLACKGVLKSDFVAEPFHAFREKEKKIIADYIRKNLADYE
ncbi:MAG TPA: dihydrodipicolinate synthase family protein [Lentisphaeria bacterium]|nr:MAG: dihydrodipicolinate synthase family protein [Lentisphaerae bacterium GWF2_50_93]HCE45818.1 dihydrodipicolinate synthase family protein [Lentisphaeria bacterium]